MSFKCHEENLRIMGESTGVEARKRHSELDKGFMKTGLEKVSFHSKPKERQCQRTLKLLHNCTHLTR